MYPCSFDLSNHGPADAGSASYTPSNDHEELTKTYEFQDAGDTSALSVSGYSLESGENKGSSDKKSSGVNNSSSSVDENASTMKISPANNGIGISSPSQAMRNTEAFSSALDEVCMSFHAMDVALKHSAFLCGEQPGAEDILRFSLLQPLLYILLHCGAMKHLFFKNLPNVARWCNELRSRSSNPFSRLYHYQEHLYAFGVDAKRIFHNRRVVDEAIGLGRILIHKEERHFCG